MIVLDRFSGDVCARLMLYRDPVTVLVAAAKHLQGRDEGETGQMSQARALLFHAACDLIVERWKKLHDNPRVLVMPMGRAK